MTNALNLLAPHIPLAPPARATDNETGVVRVRNILIVEDDVFVASRLADLFRDNGNAPILSHSLAHARDVLQSERRITAMVLELNLPDGSGIELLAETSTRDPRIPTLVVSGDWTDDALRRAQFYGAFFLPKPATAANLRAFVKWAFGSEPAGRSLDREVAELANRLRLTPREAEIVACAARGMSRPHMLEHLGITASTLKTMVRRIIRKANKKSLADLLSELHGRVFGELKKSESGVPE